MQYGIVERYLIGDDFRAITGRKNNRLGVSEAPLSKPVQQALQGLLLLGRGNGKSFAQRNAGSDMIDAKHRKLHAFTQRKMAAAKSY